MLADALCPVSVSVVLQSREMRNAFSKDGYFVWPTFNPYACVEYVTCDGRPVIGTRQA